jgi:hypothetical protein
VRSNNLDEIGKNHSRKNASDAKKKMTRARHVLSPSAMLRIDSAEGTQRRQGSKKSFLARRSRLAAFRLPVAGLLDQLDHDAGLKKFRSLNGSLTKRSTPITICDSCAKGAIFIRTSKSSPDNISSAFRSMNRARIIRFHPPVSD